MLNPPSLLKTSLHTSSLAIVNIPNYPQGLVSLSLYDTRVRKAAADRLQSSLPCLNIVGMSFAGEPLHS